MGCNCGKPKCDGQCGCKSPAVLQINNPPEYITFHKVSIPAAMGDSTTNPPKIGAYRNALVYYEADHTSWMYSTDGIPTKLTNGLTNYEDAINLPQINGHTLLGNQSSSDLGLQGELTAGSNIQIDNNVISATDTTYTAGNGIELDGTEIKAKIGDGLEFDSNGEIDIADIEQYAHFFDTVADMKQAENLIDGSFARTLGYHAKNDDGGGLYKIRSITNDDVVDEGSIIALNDADLVAELIFDEEINVKQFGARGDNSSDDYAIIQHCIDDFPQRTIYFPNGKYGISQTLVIKSGNTEQVNFRLSEDATIFALNDVSSIIEIGKVGGNYDRYVQGNIVKIEGGYIDAGRATHSGIYIYAYRQFTTITNININHVNTVGIYVERGTGSHTSADVIIRDVIINGNGSGGYSIGIVLVAYDNKINNVRINDCSVGIDEMGGSFYDNVHVLGGWPNNTISKESYEKTVGFRFRGNGISKLNLCYADTLGKGFQFNTNMTIYIQNSMAYWYLTNVEYDTRCFQLTNSNSEFRLYLDNFEVTMPTLSGDGHNVVLDLLSLDNGTRNNIGASSRFHFSNIRVSQRSRLTYKDDYIFCRAFYGDRDITINEPNAVTMTVDKYYPIAKLGGTSFYDIRLDMGTDQSINLKFYNDNSSTMTVTNLVNNAHTNAFSVAVCNMTWEFGCRRSFLCIKSTSSGCSLNPKISCANGWNNQIFTCNQFNENVPLDNPTVVSEASFNP